MLTKYTFFITSFYVTVKSLWYLWETNFLGFSWKAETNVNKYRFQILGTMVNEEISHFT